MSDRVTSENQAGLEISDVLQYKLLFQDLIKQCDRFVGEKRLFETTFDEVLKKTCLIRERLKQNGIKIAGRVERTASGNEYFNKAKTCDIVDIERLPMKTRPTSLSIEKINLHQPKKVGVGGKNQTSQSLPNAGRETSDSPTEAATVSVQRRKKYEKPVVSLISFMSSSGYFLFILVVYVLFMFLAIKQ